MCKYFALFKLEIIILRFELHLLEHFFLNFQVYFIQSRVAYWLKMMLGLHFICCLFLNEVCKFDARLLVFVRCKDRLCIIWNGFTHLKSLKLACLFLADNLRKSQSRPIFNWIFIWEPRGWFVHLCKCVYYVEFLVLVQLRTLSFEFVILGAKLSGSLVRNFSYCKVYMISCFQRWNGSFLSIKSYSVSFFILCIYSWPLLLRGQGFVKNMCQCKRTH